MTLFLEPTADRTIAVEQDLVPEGDVLDLVAARYGVHADELAGVAPGARDRGPLSLQARAVLAQQLGHRTVRSLTSDPLPDGVLETIIAAAQSAPTSSNLQLWSVVAVEDPAARVRLAALAGGQKHVATAPVLLVWVADLSRAHALAGDGLELSAAAELNTTITAFVDAALAAQNAVVAAEALGLGTVYIGALRNRPREVAAELNLPDGVAPVVGLTVGYPAVESREQVKPRLPQTAVLHRERYRPAVAEELAAYDQTISGFYASQALDGAWSDRLITRLSHTQVERGHDDLRGALEDFGLPSR